MRDSDESRKKNKGTLKGPELNNLNNKMKILFKTNLKIVINWNTFTITSNIERFINATS